MSGLGQYKDRVEELKLRMACSFTLNDSNILLKRTKERKARIKDSLFTFSSTHPYIKELSEMISTDETQVMKLVLCNDPRIKAILARRRIEKIGEKSKLARVIPFEGRQPFSFVDPVLVIQDIKIRQMAIKWRRNIIGLSKICTVCNNLFRRSHVRRCNLIPDDMDLDELLNEKDYELFYEMMLLVQSKLRSPTRPIPS